MLVAVAALALSALAPAPATPALALHQCAPSIVRHEAGGVALDAALAATLSPEQLLSSLDRLPAPELADLIAADDTVVRSLVSAPPAPRTVSTWWSGLTPGAQERLAEAAPELVGNLDGVPYAVRDEANRAVLSAEESRIRDRLESGRVGKGAALADIERLRMLEQVSASLEETPGGPDRSLLLLDTVMPGRAAVALGDLDTADYVSLLVPGALLSIREHMAEWTKVTADIYAEQTDWEHRFGADATVATISWIGYQTPDVTNVAGLDLARQGADFLSGTVNGIKDLRARDEPYVSVFAHSYGATAAMLALDEGRMSVDALALVGSPGGVADSVAQLAVPSDHVWVGEAAWDPFVHTAFFGTDPGSPEFGARPMGVSGSVDPVTGAELSASVGHDWYLEPGTESLRNLSLIGIDRGALVTGGPGSGTTLADGR